MFYSIKELVEQADKDFNGNIGELMISTETELSISGSPTRAVVRTGLYSLGKLSFIFPP